jgi:hypothetical protein
MKLAAMTSEAILQAFMDGPKSQEDMKAFNILHEIVGRYEYENEHMGTLAERLIDATRSILEGREPTFGVCTLSLELEGARIRRDGARKQFESIVKLVGIEVG